MLNMTQGTVANPTAQMTTTNDTADEPILARILSVPEIQDRIFGDEFSLKKLGQLATVSKSWATIIGRYLWRRIDWNDFANQEQSRTGLIRNALFVREVSTVHLHVLLSMASTPSTNRLNALDAIPTVGGATSIEEERDAREALRFHQEMVMHFEPMCVPLLWLLKANKNLNCLRLFQKSPHFYLLLERVEVVAIANLFNLRILTLDRVHIACFTTIRDIVSGLPTLDDLTLSNCCYAVKDVTPGRMPVDNDNDIDRPWVLNRLQRLVWTNVFPLHNLEGINDGCPGWDRHHLLLASSPHLRCVSLCLFERYSITILPNVLQTLHNLEYFCLQFEGTGETIDIFPRLQPIIQACSSKLKDFRVVGFNIDQDSIDALTLDQVRCQTLEAFGIGRRCLTDSKALQLILQRLVNLVTMTAAYTENSMCLHHFKPSEWGCERIQTLSLHFHLCGLALLHPEVEIVDEDGDEVDDSINQEMEQEQEQEEEGEEANEMELDYDNDVDDDYQRCHTDDGHFDEAFVAHLTTLQPGFVAARSLAALDSTAPSLALSDAAMLHAQREWAIAEKVRSVYEKTKQLSRLNELTVYMHPDVEELLRAERVNVQNAEGIVG